MTFAKTKKKTNVWIALKTVKTTHYRGSICPQGKKSIFKKQSGICSGEYSLFQLII